MIAIIPDVHGRQFWKDIISRKDEFEKIIFLGDYLDPYGPEGITKDQALDNFKEILEFKKDNLNKVVLFIANHDASYAISKDICECRCDYKNYNEIQKLFRDNFDLFELFYKFEQNEKTFLFSHAGIADYWINSWCKEKEANDQLKWLTNLWDEAKQDINNSIIRSVLADVSYYRGGYTKSGSIIWRDVRESISDRFGYQIFGHTMLKEPYVANNWACLDCKKVSILDNENSLCNLDGLKLPIHDR